MPVTAETSRTGTLVPPGGTAHIAGRGGRSESGTHVRRPKSQGDPRLAHRTTAAPSTPLTAASAVPVTPTRPGAPATPTEPPPRPAAGAAGLPARSDGRPRARPVRARCGAARPDPARPARRPRPAHRIARDREHPPRRAAPDRAALRLAGRHPRRAHPAAAALRRQGDRRLRAPHRLVQRLHVRRHPRDHPPSLRRADRRPAVGRHRLQLPRRPLRHDLRGPGGRRRPGRHRRPRTGLQPPHRRDRRDRHLHRGRAGAARHDGRHRRPRRLETGPGRHRSARAGAAGLQQRAQPLPRGHRRHPARRLRSQRRLHDHLPGRRPHRPAARDQGDGGPPPGPGTHHADTARHAHTRHAHTRHAGPCHAHAHHVTHAPRAHPVRPPQPLKRAQSLG
ncbi:protein of unknown function [Streptomyces murinus]